MTGGRFFFVHWLWIFVQPRRDPPLIRVQQHNRKDHGSSTNTNTFTFFFPRRLHYQIRGFRKAVQKQSRLPHTTFRIRIGIGKHRRHRGGRSQHGATGSRLPEVGAVALVDATFEVEGSIGGEEGYAIVMAVEGPPCFFFFFFFVAFVFVLFEVTGESPMILSMHLPFIHMPNGNAPPRNMSIISNRLPILEQQILSFGKPVPHNVDPIRNLGSFELVPPILRNLNGSRPSQMHLGPRREHGGVETAAVEAPAAGHGIVVPNAVSRPGLVVEVR